MDFYFRGLHFPWTVMLLFFIFRFEGPEISVDCLDHPMRTTSNDSMSWLKDLLLVQDLFHVRGFPP